VIAAPTLRQVRRRADLTLRELAGRAGTSHSALAAYEAGRKVPSVATFARILRAAGVELDGGLRTSVSGADDTDRGRELIEALDLAAMFPARHEPILTAPVFPRGPVHEGPEAPQGSTSRAGA
jgi:transcriptional regulator with XRE-family HTH domain